MQRTANMPEPRVSRNPPGVGSWRLTPARARISASSFACAVAFSGGTRPSGGSITSDVRLVSLTLSPGSNQNWL